MKPFLTTLLFLLAISYFAAGQNLNKNYFRKTDWFVNNKDSVFFIADTVKLIKHSNYGPDWDKQFGNEYAENEMKYLTHGDFVNLNFHKNKKMHISKNRFNCVNIDIGRGTWKFNKKKQLLLIYNNYDGDYLSLKVISAKTIKIPSRFNNDLLNTTELTLVAIHHSARCW